jgi:hypothetical protein
LASSWWVVGVRSHGVHPAEWLLAAKLTRCDRTEIEFLHAAGAALRNPSACVAPVMELWTLGPDRR